MTDTLADGIVLVAAPPVCTGTDDVTCQLGPLASGASTEVRLTVLPTMPGVVMNAASVRGNAVDPDLSNNTASTASTVVVGSGPNLTITWTSLTQTCAVKKGTTRCTLKGVVTVRNDGTAATQKTQLAFVQSADGALDPGDRVLESVSLKVLKPGKTARKSLGVSLRPGETARGAWVLAVADAGGAVAEANEYDNVAAFGPLP